jgi:predicted ribosome quality control (RQC) complex YloA/Tae2 family protein
MLRIFVIVGAQQSASEEAAGTSRRPVELLLTRSGYRDAVAADLADDPLLTDDNIENFKKACDFVMVRPEHFPAGNHGELLIWISLLMQNVLTDSRRISEKLWGVVSDHKELAALKRRVDDEKTKNLHIEKVNAELQRQLEEQKKALEAQKDAHQEQLKEQKKAHQGKPLLASNTCTE